MISVAKNTDNSSGRAENLQIISCFSRIFYSYSDFSSYLCSQSIMTRKGYGVIIFKKVLKKR